MKPSKLLRSTILFPLLLLMGTMVVDATCAHAQDSDIKPVPDALPYTLTIEPVEYKSDVSPLPRLQAYVLAEHDGKWLIVGGRGQGLHTFLPEPVNNFPVKMANKFIWVIDPATGENWSFDLSSLPSEIADPLQASNQQEFHDRSTDEVLIVGGYGWDSKKKDMITFDTITKFKLPDMIAAVMSSGPEAKRAKKIQSLIEMNHDDRFTVTGGELKKLGNQYCLVFGQRFMGQYHAFSSGNATSTSTFSQKYTEEIRVFSLRPHSLDVLSFSVMSSQSPDRPYHRRDGVIIDGIDPKTGQPQISAFGGVFAVGTTEGYTSPIYLRSVGGLPSASEDKTVEQLFSQYQCPVVVVHDEKAKTVHHTFYGGISHSYFHQTEKQKEVYDLVNKQGRADGLPFVSDVYTLSQNASGEYTQYIAPEPMPMVSIPPDAQKTIFERPKGDPNYAVTETNLLGTSINFILNESLVDSGVAYPNGVLRLNQIEPGESVDIGHFYGGITAVFPYALVPNFGTFAGNVVFRVTLTAKPSDAIPADSGTVANPAANTR